jgi:hypothetical protein
MIQFKTVETRAIVEVDGTLYKVSQSDYRRLTVAIYEMNRLEKLISRHNPLVDDILRMFIVGNIKLYQFKVDHILANSEAI